MMRTFLTTVLMLLLGRPVPWAAAESLLDDEEATKAETLKLLDATGAKARFVSVATINSTRTRMRTSCLSTSWEPSGCC